jgi:hypothetical protein
LSRSFCNAIYFHLAGLDLYPDSLKSTHTRAFTPTNNTTQLAAKIRHDVAAFESRVVTGSVSLHPAVDSDYAIRFGIKQLNPWIHFERLVFSGFRWRSEQRSCGKIRSPIS